ncbi:hypothetical protein ACOMHN_001514 [Nucella lapillus]
MLSARLLAKFTAVPRRLSVLCRCSSSAGGGDKAAKEPMKPFEQPKTSGASAESKPPPPPPPQPSEPFDNSKYQAQELFSYTTMSFYDLECAMSPQRCPVPSSLKKPS